MTGLLLVPPVALADPRALRAPRDAPPFPAGSRKRTGKGQRRVPSWASTPDDDSSADDDSAEEISAEESGAEAAVSAARQGAQMAETANRNTSASVGHRLPRRQRVSWHPPCASAINAIDACGNRGDEVGASDAI